jgi:hypothetical protein
MPSCPPLRPGGAQLVLQHLAEQLPEALAMHNGQAQPQLDERAVAYGWGGEHGDLQPLSL